jgi:hypothetical protein
MSSFDPDSVRKAVEEFVPRRPQKFQDLIPAKEVIVELRQKRASYRAIAEFLTQHCLPTSKTAIAAFCHQVIGEIVRPRRRPGRKRSPVFASTNGGESAPDSAPASEASTSAKPPADSNGNQTPPGRTRGPRIAQVRMLKPENA